MTSLFESDGATANSTATATFTVDDIEWRLRFVIWALTLWDVDEDGDWVRAMRAWPGFKEAAARPHAGDCTNLPHSCARCHYEEVCNLARAAMEVLA